MIKLHDILGYKNRVIYQDDNFFSFSLDSVLLSNFCSVRKKDKKILDFCTGNGIVPFIISLRTDSKIEGIEIQKKIYDLAIKSNKKNKLLDQITFYNMDVKNFCTKDKYDSYDLITCNPPYFRYTENSNVNLSCEKLIARHEYMINIEEIIKCSFKLLKDGGNFSLIHRTDRFIEVISLLKKYYLEPKRIIFIYNKLSKGSQLFFIESQKNGETGLKIEKPFIVYNEDNTYTSDYNFIMEGDIR